MIKLIKENDDSYNYQLLGRLVQDCKYFLGAGNGSEKHLWAGSVKDQISKMKELYNSFQKDKKPEWITLSDIKAFETEMQKKLNGKKESYKRLHEQDVEDSYNTGTNVMIITIDSGLNADGCTIEIKKGNNSLFKQKYSYGYNASYNRRYARYAQQDYDNANKYGWSSGYTLKPYIGDIITELCDKYYIDKNDIVFKSGKNVFTGGNVSDKKVSEFINSHIKGIREESYKKLHEQDVEIEVKHKGILEVPEGKNVDDLPVSHFVNLAKKKGLSKITKALNNLQVWNKNDDPKLSKWAGDMIDKVSKKMEKEDKKESLKSIKESLDFEVIHESDDDEGNPTLWGAEVNSHHYGKYMWIELSDVDGYYDLVYNAGGDNYKTIKSFMSFNRAKKFAENLIRQERIEYDED